MSVEYEARGVRISPCKVYRYQLDRIWDEGLPRVWWVMLNPSTADGLVDDPTIRKCVGFAQKWSAGSISVVNLFALRATQPRELLRAQAPMGAENLTYLGKAVRESVAPNRLIFGWGAARKPELGSRVRDILLAGGHAECLRTTKSGAPGHPLYIPYSAEPQGYWR